MARSRRGRKKKRVYGPRENGTVYVLAMKVDGVEVYKVGCTGNINVRKRILQIIDSYEQANGVYPECKVVHTVKASNYYQVESKVHKMLEEYSWDSGSRWSGHTEIVKCELAIIVDKIQEAMVDDSGCVDNLYER